MPPLNIEPQTLKAATTGAAEDDVVRIKGGQAVTARQSFFGRVLRFFSGGNREARAENAAVRHTLLTELKQLYNGANASGAGIAEEAMRKVGLDPDPAAAPGTKPIAVRQIREAHGCARLLSEQAKRSAAGLAASNYSPAAPGFEKFARNEAGVDPAALTVAQQSHYQYMLQRHVALDPGRYVGAPAELHAMARKTLIYVSRMSDSDIDAAQSRLLSQRDLAGAVVDGLTTRAGIAPFVKNLHRLHDACQQGVADTMLGDMEYGSFLTIDELALERAAARLTPQEAREAYLHAMAQDGTGRTVLSAIAELGDQFGRMSLNPRLSPEREKALEVAAKRTREFQSTAETVLKVLARRGGVEDADRQISAVQGRTPERARCAAGARVAVRRQVVSGVIVEEAQIKARAADFKNVRRLARNLLLSGHLENSLRQRGWLDASVSMDERLLHQVRAKIAGPLHRQLHELEHRGEAPAPADAGVRALLENVLNSEAEAIHGMLKSQEQTRQVMQPVIAALNDSLGGSRNLDVVARACQQSRAAFGVLAASAPANFRSLDLQSLQHEREELGPPQDSDSASLRGWRAHLDGRIAELIAKERAADLDALVADDNEAIAGEFLAQWASALPREDAERIAGNLQATLDGAAAPAGIDLHALIQIRDAVQKPLGITAGKGVLIAMEDQQLQQTLAKPDTLPASFHSKPVREVKGADAAQSFFANGFYQDMHRMHIFLGRGESATRIGAPATAEPTDADIHAAKVDGLARLVEFVGDEAMAARVSHFINQKLFAPMSVALQAANSPIALADGTRGQILPVSQASRKSVTLSKAPDGAIQVHVEQNYVARGMVNPDDHRELDPARSHLRMSFDFSITADEVKAMSPVTYDFRLTQAA